MLDIKQVRKDPQSVAKALKKKRFDFPLEEFVRLDSQRKEADVRSQDLLAERKKASKQIGELIAQGKRSMKPKQTLMRCLTGSQRRMPRLKKRKWCSRP